MNCPKCGLPMKSMGTVKELVEKCTYGVPPSTILLKGDVRRAVYQAIPIIRKAVEEEAKEQGFVEGKRYFLCTTVVDAMETEESNRRLLSMNDIEQLPMWRHTWAHDWQVPLSAQDVVSYMAGRKAVAEEIVNYLQFNANSFRMSASGHYEICLTNAQWHYLKSLGKPSGKDMEGK